MSATVADRPTRPQPALPADTYPYPEPSQAVHVPVMAARTDADAIAHLLAAARDLDQDRLDAARATGQRYADMQPGTPAPRGGEPVYLAVMGEHYGTEPQPNFASPEPVPAPEPVPGWSEGVVRGLLIAALEDACRWYGDMDGRDCPDCGEAARDACEWHSAKRDRYWEYSDLHNHCVDAAFDATALAVVAASVRAGKADAGDLASPGSHLDLILAAALGAKGGAE